MCRIPKTVFFATRLRFNYNDKQPLQEGLSACIQCVGMGKLGWVKAIAIMPDVFISIYMSIMLFWLLYEWNVNVPTPHPAIEISLTHITRSDKGSLSPRTFKHSELLHKTMYLVLNFKLNLGTYEHDLLAYERDARGCKLCT